VEMKKARACEIKLESEAEANPSLTNDVIKMDTDGTVKSSKSLVTGEELKKKSFAK